MTRSQLVLLAAALTFIGWGLYHIAIEKYALGAVFSGVGAAFASLSAVFGGIAKAKEKGSNDAGG